MCLILHRCESAWSHTHLVCCAAEQFWSTEALGMGVFYTLNVFIMQFYLGGWWGGANAINAAWPAVSSS
jgi:hypothetical protein